MSVALWFVLVAIALWGAYSQFMNAWFLYQTGKRHRADVDAPPPLRLVVSNSPTEKDAA